MARSDMIRRSHNSGTDVRIDHSAHHFYGDTSMKTLEATMSNHKIVSKEEWLKARTALLAKEKELTRQRDELSRQRRELPWVKVEKKYVLDGPQGKLTLADPVDGRSQLVT